MEDSPSTQEQTANGDAGLTSAEFLSANRNQRRVGEIQINKQELQPAGIITVGQRPRNGVSLALGV